MSIQQQLKEGLSNILRRTIPTSIGAERAKSKVQGGNTTLLQQRNATICTNLMCPNTDYMPLTQEKCPDCNKLAKPTTKQQEPPYVKCE